MNAQAAELNAEGARDEELRDVGAWSQAVALSFRFLMVVAVAIALGWLVSNVRRVTADDQAVVVRFGRVVRVHGPGLLFALPRPLEKVSMIPASARQIALKIERFADGGSNDNSNRTMGFDINQDPRLNAGFLLTGDSSVVHLEGQLFYQVSDPEAYMVSADHVRPALQRLLIAAAIDTIGARDLDAILVARPENASKNREAGRRERLRGDLVQAVNGRLRKLAAEGTPLGVEVSRVDLVASIPRGAHDAFDSVLAVTQEAERAIAAAQTNKEIVAQKAASEADTIKSSASASAEENVSKATVATASITALGSANQDMSRGMQMSRLYYDRIGPILKKAGKVQLVSGDEGGAGKRTMP
jgi:regulator of protease activity HflC (stomatin/prohibitin superfamily)